MSDENESREEVEEVESDWGEMAVARGGAFMLMVMAILAWVDGRRRSGRERYFMGRQLGPTWGRVELRPLGRRAEL